MGTGIRTEAFGMVFDSFAECCRHFGEEPRKIREYMKSNNIGIEQALKTYKDSIKVQAFGIEFRDIKECCKHYNVEYPSVKANMNTLGLTLEEALNKCIKAREQREKEYQEELKKSVIEYEKRLQQSLGNVKKSLRIKNEIESSILAKQDKNLKCLYVITANEHILSKLDKCVIVIGSNNYMIDKSQLEIAVANKYIDFVNLKVVDNNTLVVTESVELNMLELIRRNIGCKTLYAAYMTYLGNKNKFKNWYNRYLDREFDEDNTNKNSGSIILNRNLGHKSSLGTKYALNSSSKLTNMANYE